MSNKAMRHLFRRFATWAAEATGTVYAFCLAVSIIIVWAVTGPVFGFSDTWQLIINTGTTIVTFMMVFLIQSTQNRDNSALHAKLDELIVHTKGAHDELTIAEDFTDEELAALKKHFKKVGERGGTDDKDLLGVEGLPRNGTKHAAAKNGTATRAPSRRKRATTKR